MLTIRSIVHSIATVIYYLRIEHRDLYSDFLALIYSWFVVCLCVLDNILFVIFAPMSECVHIHDSWDCLMRVKFSDCLETLAFNDLHCPLALGRHWNWMNNNK